MTEAKVSCALYCSRMPHTFTSRSVYIKAIFYKAEFCLSVQLNCSGSTLRIWSSQRWN